jgi:hypothetical protein
VRRVSELRDASLQGLALQIEFKEQMVRIPAFTGRMQGISQSRVTKAEITLGLRDMRSATYVLRRWQLTPMQSP